MTTPESVTPDLETKLENLALLALGLHRLAARVDNIGFYMKWFYYGEEQVPTPDKGRLLRERVGSGYAEHDCGSAACAVGHGPSFGITLPHSGEDHVSWNHYYNQVFLPTGMARYLHRWMFNGNWGRWNAIRDDYPRDIFTRAHAAKRIAWALKHYEDEERFTAVENYHVWKFRKEFEDFTPDWNEIEKMIPPGKLEGIAWINYIGKTTGHE